jgi:hypothetical protein
MTKTKKQYNELFRFLKEHGAFNSFKRAVKGNYNGESTLNKKYKHDYLNLFENTATVQIIDRSITWNETFEGHQYWQNLSNEYEYEKASANKNRRAKES